MALLDGTNVTKERRSCIRDRVSKEDGFDILWIECICDDPNVKEHNLEELRERSPDFVADHDFQRRVEFYQKDYLTVEVSLVGGSTGNISVHMYICIMTYYTYLHILKEDHRLSDDFLTTLTDCLTSIFPLFGLLLFCRKGKECMLRLLTREGKLSCMRSMVSYLPRLLRS